MDLYLNKVVLPKRLLKELFIFQNGFKLLVRLTFFANEKATNCLCTANSHTSQQSKFNELAYTQL